MDEHEKDCAFVVGNVPNTACTCGFLDRDATRNFEERNAVIHADHLTEMKRRRAPWATCPDSRGNALDAQMVPTATLDAAIAELHYWRQMAESIKTRGAA